MRSRSDVWSFIHRQKKREREMKARQIWCETIINITLCVHVYQFQREALYCNLIRNLLSRFRFFFVFDAKPNIFLRRCCRLIMDYLLHLINWVSQFSIVGEAMNEVNDRRRGSPKQEEFVLLVCIEETSLSSLRFRSMRTSFFFVVIV